MKAPFGLVAALALTSAVAPAAATVAPLPRLSLPHGAALLPSYQPVAIVRGQPVAVDTGGVTAVERSRMATLTTSRVIELLGRSDHALIAPDGYLQHWYLRQRLRASVGPTWLRKGRITFDFATGHFSTDPLASAVALPAIVSSSYLFVVLAIDGARHTCLFDTGAVGRVSPALRGPPLRAVNLLEGSAFDRLAAAHPGWVVAGTKVTVAEDRGTAEAAILTVPLVRIGPATFPGVEFVRRREKETFVTLSRKLGASFDCDAGGALFRERSVQFDLQRGKLSVSRGAAR